MGRCLEPCPSGKVCRSKAQKRWRIRFCPARLPEESPEAAGHLLRAAAPRGFSISHVFLSAPLQRLLTNSFRGQVAGSMFGRRPGAQVTDVF